MTLRMPLSLDDKARRGPTTVHCCSWCLIAVHRCLWYFIVFHCSSSFIDVRCRSLCFVCSVSFALCFVCSMYHFTRCGHLAFGLLGIVLVLPHVEWRDSRLPPLLNLLSTRIESCFPYTRPSVSDAVLQARPPYPLNRPRRHATSTRQYPPDRSRRRAASARLCPPDRSRRRAASTLRTRRPPSTSAFHARTRVPLARCSGPVADPGHPRMAWYPRLAWLLFKNKKLSKQLSIGIFIIPKSGVYDSFLVQ